MLTVNKSQVELVDGKLIGEASTMGLAPGEWPDFIAVVDDGGKGFLFQRGGRLAGAGAEYGYGYFSRASGDVLEVIND